MEINEIVSLISTVGFPIFACCVMGWYVRESNNKNRDEIEKLHEQYNEQINDIKESLNNNTLAIQKLCDKL